MEQGVGQMWGEDGGAGGGAGRRGRGGLLMKEKAFVVYPADRPVCG